MKNVILTTAATVLLASGANAFGLNNSNAIAWSTASGVASAPVSVPAPAVSPAPVAAPVVQPATVTSAPVAPVDAPVSKPNRSKSCEDFDHVMVFTGKYAGNVVDRNGNKIKLSSCYSMEQFMKAEVEKEDIMKVVFQSRLYMNEEAQNFFAK
jgi:hypothetical protein